MHWGDTVKAKVAALGPLVLGIDPVAGHAPSTLPREHGPFLQQYTAALLAGAQGRVGFVKFQSAFFEATGSGGVVALARCMAMARDHGFAVILDVKRGDVGSTAQAYAKAYMTPGASDLEADCITVSPFLGPDSLAPFIDCARTFGKGVFVLAKTSNPGSGWLQDQVIEGLAVSHRIADLVAKWAEETLGEGGIGAVGAVVGATYPAEAALLRQRMARSAILAPGLGAQGGDLAAMAAMATPTGPVLISASRGVAAVEDRSVAVSDYVSLISARIDAFRTALNLPPCS